MRPKRDTAAPETLDETYGENVKHHKYGSTKPVSTLLYLYCCGFSKRQKYYMVVSNIISCNFIINAKIVIISISQKLTSYFISWTIQMPNQPTCVNHITVYSTTTLYVRKVIRANCVARLACRFVYIISVLSNVPFPANQYLRQT